MTAPRTRRARHRRAGTFLDLDRRVLAAGVVLATFLVTAAGAVPTQAAPPPLDRRLVLMPQRFAASGLATPPVTARDVFEVSWFTWLQWPLPPATAISDYFGPRECAGCSSYHQGVDFDPGNGTPVAAIADGTVLVAQADEGGLGVHVVVEHIVDGAPMQSTYAHLQAGSVPVAVGDAVLRGQLLGLVGTTGQSTGPHLHFAIQVGGGYIDPLPWMLVHVNI